MNKSPSEFYNEVADYYDAMTRFSSRLNDKNEANIIHKWVRKYNMSRVLDTACGSGLHAILLANMGLEVIGTDISEAMLDRARENSKKSGVHVSFVQSSFQHLTDKIQGTFDTILCLGNSLPHLINEKSLTLSLQQFNRLLEKDGVVVIQLLNYSKILKQRERIVGIRKEGNREFIRFYDFLAQTIRFNILNIEWKDKKAIYEMHSTELYPYQKDYLKSVLQANGFEIVDVFGNMHFQAFDEHTSSNLILVAKKL